MKKVIPKTVDFIPKEIEPDIIYISFEYETAVHMCPCGCGLKTVTPFSEGGWHLTMSTKENETIVSLSPSIANPCRAHYYITNNTINFV